jgi:hypothetical protein
MNRWRQRLAELRSDGERAPGLSARVQNVQNVQNPDPEPTIEHFEHFEQRTATARPSLAPACDKVEEGRAAIRGASPGIEHDDGGIPPAWAASYARLDPNRPPADVPLPRWRRLVDDVGRFLDGPFCAVAASLGWGPLDLFGCDRDRPYARIDQCGLL